MTTLSKNNRILICPHCGKTKLIISYNSWNTFGAKLWSDRKLEAPMLPQQSRVLQCSHCRKYFFTYKQEVKYQSDDSPCFDEPEWGGELFLWEIRDAIKQFIAENEMDDNDEIYVREIALHAYNDRFYRSNPPSHRIPIDEKIFFKENSFRLIELLLPKESIHDKLLVAELYRECLMFKKCLLYLDSIDTDDENPRLKQIATQIRRRAELSISSVFIIETDK